jgi:hypothetical protein
METISKGRNAIIKKDPKKTKAGKSEIVRIKVTPTIARANIDNISLFIKFFLSIQFF